MTTLHPSKLHWAREYIGLPYRDGGRDRDGVDCWGLLRLVYLEQEGIELPMLPGVTSKTVIARSREIVHQIVEQGWVQAEPIERAAVAISLQESPHHVGIWTEADGGKVVHTREGIGVVAETLRSLRMRGLKRITFYRYDGVCD